MYIFDTNEKNYHLRLLTLIIGKYILTTVVNDI